MLCKFLMNILTELSTEWLRVCGRANMCLYMLYYLKGMPFETVTVVRDKRGLSRGSVTFPTFGGNIFVVSRGGAPLTEWVGPQDTSGARLGPVGGARWAHPC